MVERFQQKRAVISQKVCQLMCVIPRPPKIGIPIRYPYVRQASTLANGSKTVKIKGAPISLKNDPYYKNSSGNEPITNQLKARGHFRQN